MGINMPYNVCIDLPMTILEKFIDSRSIEEMAV